MESRTVGTAREEGRVKRIKCDLFVIVGYPYQSECQNTIEVSDDFKEAMQQMNTAGWKKCGDKMQFGYFCPEHSKHNQFYAV